MTSAVQRTSQTVETDLANWMQAITEPDVCIEEYVDGDRRVIRVDIPGVHPNRDLDLTVDEEVLRLHGQRHAEKHDQHHTVIRYGTFERIMSLPLGTRPEDVEAEYVDGVLTVSIPLESPAASAKALPTHGTPESQTVPVAHWSLGDN